MNTDAEIRHYTTNTTNYYVCYDCYTVMLYILLYEYKEQECYVFYVCYAIIIYISYMNISSKNAVFAMIAMQYFYKIFSLWIREILPISSQFW